MESPQTILEFLDRRFDAIEMPCFGNMNIDYISSRLLAFRDDSRWLILFNSIAWWPSGEGLMTILECVGNCVQEKEGFSSLITGQIKYDEMPNDFDVTVRGKPIPLSELNIISRPDLFSEYEPNIAFTGNPDLYKPPTNPNTDWSFWFPK